jgi:tetratricopeptide (TPR) repeat protein
MKRRMATVLAAMAVAMPVQAQSYGQLEKLCFFEATNEQRIAACDAVIAARRGTTEEMATAYYKRANGYRNQHRYDRALPDYDKALSLKPDYIAALNNRGLVYDARGQTDRAIQDYDEAIRIWPGFVHGLINRGYAHRSKRQYDRAIEDFD